MKDMFSEFAVQVDSEIVNQDIDEVDLYAERQVEEETDDRFDDLVLD